MKYAGLLKYSAATILCALLLSGCAEGSTPPEAGTRESVVYTAAEVEALSGLAEELTVWTVYWDIADSTEILYEYADEIEHVSVFAAYFEDQELFLPEKSSQMMRKISSWEPGECYLSVVNDVVRGGKTTQKDTEILWELLGQEDTAAAHAEQLIQLAADNGCSGIEIDYEKIRKDMKLWEAFLQFEKELILCAEQAGLNVRIVLEPGTPAEQLDFPPGAEYVVMCYNLYGGRTEPGPKADLDFLSSMYEKFKDLPNVSYAFANGGYHWSSGSETAEQIRASEAEALAERHGASPQRDADSGALYFSYEEKGKEHVIWYADDTTLAVWAEHLNTLAGRKQKFSLWRL